MVVVAEAGGEHFSVNITTCLSKTQEKILFFPWFLDLLHQFEQSSSWLDYMVTLVASM